MKNFLTSSLFFVVLLGLFTSCQEYAIENMQPTSPKTRSISEANQILATIWPDIEKYQTGITKEQCLNELLKVSNNKTTCYTVNNMLDLLSSYGLQPQNIIPSVPNSYFQDANCNVAAWTSAVNIWNPLDSTSLESNLIPNNITWKLDADPVINTSSFNLPFYTYILNNKGQIVINPNCNGIFQPSCNGGHNLTIIMSFDDGTIYQRTGTAYGWVNNTPLNIMACNELVIDPLSLETYNVFCPCYLTFDSYEFCIQSLPYDLNNDFVVSSTDLLLMLANFC